MKEWFNSLQAREQLYVMVGAIALIIMLGFFGLWLPLTSKVDTLNTAVMEKDKDLKWMLAAKNQVRALQRRNPSGSRGGQSLMSQVDQKVQTAGLKSALQRMEPDGNNKAKLWFDAGSFDAIIQVLGQLQQQGLNVVNLSVTPTGKTGLVNARVTLSRGGI